MVDYVQMHASLHPTRAAVTDLTFDLAWTYQELNQFIGQTATVLQGLGVEEGARVACLAKNRAEFIALQFACARLGAIFVPLNWRLSGEELSVLIQDCTPTVVYADDLASLLEHAKAVVADLNIQPIDGLIAKCGLVEPAPCHPMSPDLPSLMLYTSGTTGKPKGVLLSERNLTENAINFSLLGEVEGGSHLLCESPMFHTIGMVASVRPALFRGAKISVSDRFLPARTLARLSDAELRLTHYFCVPQMAVMLREEPDFNADKLRGLTALFTGGAPHPAAQIQDWLNDGIAIVDGYGMSESGTVFGMPLDQTLIGQKAGCVGVSSPRVQSRLVDDEGNILGAGCAGELQIKGDNITRGYWQRPEETAKAFTEDGWFRTGDVLLRDNDGFYRVTDRKKDMYISGGENVYPAEVEAVLVKYPGIKELAVVGLPDEKWGEVGCLFYVAEEAITLVDIEAYLTEHVARYKIPKQVQKISAIPRNSLGKILKHQLRDEYSVGV
ncbi:AMP-binding protein [Halioxenophilus aromaticivorans]|uniref:AMP-binding protein n=1 Tax=Halioxenophilus aromaticivorans TaxID=1306992 RepID=A0AAV3TY08_9ALTE